MQRIGRRGGGAGGGGGEGEEELPPGRPSVGDVREDRPWNVDEAEAEAGARLRSPSRRSSPASRSRLPLGFQLPGTTLEKEGSQEAKVGFRLGFSPVFRLGVSPGFRAKVGFRLGFSPGFRAKD
jgi:hypothetical protein